MARATGTAAGIIRVEEVLSTRTVLNRSLAKRLRQRHSQGPERYRSAAAKPAATTTALTPLGQAWRSLGPAQVSTTAYGQVTGRVSSIAVDPADTTGNTVYLGTTGGGVWKSTNAAGAVGAVSFTPLTDDLPAFTNGDAASISIGALTVQPGGTGVVLAGTGDPNGAQDSYYGSGLLRSTDGGLTWSLISHSSDASQNLITNYYFNGLAFAGFAWSMATPNLVVAAVSQSAEAVLTGADQQDNQAGLQSAVMGIYYSLDAGQSWRMATITDGPAQVVQTSLIPPGGGGNAVTAVVWNPVRNRFYAAVRFHGYYESPDGITWTRLANQPGGGLTRTQCPTQPNTTGSPGCPIYRGALASQSSTGDLFALTVDVNLLDQGLWQDQCGATSGACSSGTVTFGRQLPSAALEDSSGAIPLGDYDLWLAATSAGSDTVLFAGTVDIFRCSVASGCAFRNTTNTATCAAARVAPFQHAVDASFAGALSLVFFGNDSGLWRSTDDVGQTQLPCNADDASHFDNLNGDLGSLAEIQRFAEDLFDPGILLAGLGVNGTVASTGSGETTWPQVLDGYGSYVAIDQVNSQNWYAQSAAGVGIYLCPHGASCEKSGFDQAVGYPQVGADAYASLAPSPFLLDPVDNATLILGTCHVWSGPADGLGWSASDMLGGLYPSQGPDCAGNALIRSLAAGTSGPGGRETLYAGMEGLGFFGPQAYSGHLFQADVSAANPVPGSWTDARLSPVSNDLSGFNPQDFPVSSVTVDPHDATGQTVYATIEGFRTATASTPTVYVSTDAGANWLNITSNLPANPVNSLAIDPGDVNTIYVALDTGVYVTAAVTTCAVQNCWSLYGTGLPNSPVTQLATFSAGGQGLLRAGTYGRGIWEIPLVSSVGAPTTTITIAPTALAFGAQPIQTQSAAQTVVITNTGSSALLVSGVTVGSDFTAMNSCAVAVPPGDSCSIQVKYLPSVAGPGAANMTIAANVAGGQAIVPLSGVATAGGVVALLPGALNFGISAIGVTTTPAQNVTVSNTGASSIGLQPPIVSGDFSLAANTCGSSLAASTGCTVGVVFTPVASGQRTGTLSVTDDAGTQTVSLTGVGSSAATDTLSATSLTFGSQTVGTASAAQTVTLTNSGDFPLNSVAVRVTGDFQLVNGCGNSVAAHANCSLTVTFVPTHTGPDAGSVTVADMFGRPQAVTLLGAGASVATDSLSPTALTFAPQPVGTISTPQAVTLSDAGDAPLNLITIGTTGDFRAANACGSLLGGHAKCSIMVTYAPTLAGPASGTLVLSDMLGKPQTVTLQGSGLAAATDTLSPASVSFGDQIVGATSPARLVTLTNSGDVPLTAISVAVQGEFGIASGCGVTLAAHSGCAISVTYSPTQPGDEKGTLTINDVYGHPQALQLTGTGVPGTTASIFPTQISFGTQIMGTTSTAQVITLTNTGAAVLRSIAAVVSGDFHLYNDCNKTLASQATCSMRVAYVAASVGPANGAVTITSSNAGSLGVTLLGSGIAAAAISAQPATADFGIWGVGGTSPAQSVTITNTGGVSIDSLALSVTSDYSLTADSCGPALAPGASCAVQIAFSPSRGGSRPGTLTVASATLDKSFKLPLSGNGLNFNLKTDGESTATVSDGQSATYQLQAVPSAGSSGPITLSCSGAPQNATCTVTPAATLLADGVTSTISVSIATVAASRLSAGRQRAGRSPMFAALFPIGLLLVMLPPLRRWRGRLLPLALLVLAALLPTGCGVTASNGSSQLTTPSGGPTGSDPSTTYTPVITAAAPGITQTVQLTLIVK